MRDVAHFVMVPLAGAEVVAFCGEQFIARDDVPDLPICRPCYEKQSAMAVSIMDDYEGRLFDVAEALFTRDELGQEIWLHAEAADKIANAFWRPGPARLEGPLQENGKF